MFDLNSDNKVVLKEPGVLLINEFKVLWESTKNKQLVLKEFAYIYFKVDFKSPYRNSKSKKEIEQVLKKDLDFPSNWKPSKEILEAEKKYNELQTTKTLKVLLAAELALDQITNYFETFNVDSIKSDKKADAINKLMGNIIKIDETSAKLESAKKRVEEEIKNKKLSGTKILTSRELPKSKRK